MAQDRKLTLQGLSSSSSGERGSFLEMQYVSIGFVSLDHGAVHALKKDTP